MRRVQRQPFSEVRNLPEEILQSFNTIAQNELDELRVLPTLAVDEPSIDELASTPWPEHAIVIAKGPSLFRHDYIGKIRRALLEKKRLMIFCVDVAVPYCLRDGLVPDIVVTVDPSIKILRAFGDSEGLSEREGDYSLYRYNPHEKNGMISCDEIMMLLDAYGSSLTVAISIYTHRKVYERLKQVGARIYQFFPMSDDESYMTEIWKQHPDLVALSCGGNVGTAAYNLARFMERKSICLCALDLSYAPNTPLNETVYYPLVKDKPELADRLFIPIRNPHLNETWFTDTVFLSYAHVTLRMIEEAAKSGIETVNATGGGIVFGPNVKWLNLDEWLRNVPSV
jgi:hypothetical protein